MSQTLKECVIISPEDVNLSIHCNACRMFNIAVYTKSGLTMTGRILQDFKNVRCFMSIIDQQSIQIIELQTQVDLLHNEVFELRKGKDSQEVISELMARIDVQADRIAELEAQVAALKKIAEEEIRKKIEQLQG